MVIIKPAFSKEKAGFILTGAHFMTNITDEVTARPLGINRQQSAIDWVVLDALKILQKPGKPDVRKSLMSAYLASSPALFASITASIIAQDGPALMNAAHSMKSSSLAIGAKEFGNTCAELEQQGRSCNFVEASALIAQAEYQFESVCLAFRDALEQS
jgi:HPt (histidine-containing phosphotransfer) domain-containing protein